MTAPALPVIDLRGLSEGPAALGRIASEVGLACRETGFFYAVHAPVPAAARAAVFAAADAFFALPAGRKTAVSIARSPHNRGYVGRAAESLDPARGPDDKEAFNVGLDLDATYAR